MLLMGDEVRRTQRGNNNAYCQDNEISWFDWDDVERHADIWRFTRGLIRFHQRSAFFRDRTFWGEPNATRITWHGVRLNDPEWDANSHTLAFELFHAEAQQHLHVMLNAYWEPLEFELPGKVASRRWLRLVDTALATPDDFSEPAAPLPASQTTYRCEARSSVVLIGG
jgi:glycogen operon protein